jgi:short subunit dehydrogenase-like uncharacterized protein
MITMKNRILIYGASGYTAKLFIKEVLNERMDFVLAGRSNFETKYTYRKFSLDKSTEIEINLHDIKLLINLAGPFSKTNVPLIEACIRTKTHYIDIAGEYPEFRTAFGYDQQAIAAGIMLMPGCGFGVVPTDIAAGLARELLPDATHLTLGFITKGAASRGTLSTVLKGINASGIRVVEGKEMIASPASSSLLIQHAGKNSSLVYNPWRADLFSAQISTGVKNIETYSNFPGFVVKMMKGKLLWLRNFILNTAIKWLPEGPTLKQLSRGSTLVIAKVNNKKGEIKEVHIVGPEAYTFTVQTLMAIAKKIMENKFKPGYQTPMIYGKELITSINKVTINQTR